MKEKEIKALAKQMAEGKVDLKDWLERDIDEHMKKLGFTLQETPSQTETQETAQIMGTIIFVKRESAKDKSE